MRRRGRACRALVELGRVPDTRGEVGLAFFNRCRRYRKLRLETARQVTVVWGGGCLRLNGASRIESAGKSQG